MDWEKQKTELLAEHTKTQEQAAKMAQHMLRLEGALAMCEKALAAAAVDAVPASDIESEKE